MSRPAIAVAALLTLIAVVAIMFGWEPTSETIIPRPDLPRPRTVAPVDRDSVAPAPTSSAPPVASQVVQPPKLETRDDLAALLAARGLPAERLITAYAEWRRARGFMDNESLAGAALSGLGLDYYDALDTTTLKNLAASGDFGAMTVVAGRTYSQDRFGALDEFVKAGNQGSAAAMLATAETLDSLAQTGANGPDPKLAERLLALGRGDPNHDLRVDALAWTLAAIRQHGPAIVDESRIAQIERTAARLPPADLDAACGRSLAIFAEQSARQASGGELPPVFATPANLYARLPCGQTPVPVTPPRGFSSCESVPATAGTGAPLEVWICPEN